MLKRASRHGFGWPSSRATPPPANSWSQSSTGRTSRVTRRRPRNSPL